MIKIKSHHIIKPEGSLRFNYMIPVPKDCLNYFDFRSSEIASDRRSLIEKEFRFCKSNMEKIQRQAKRTYYRVINGVDEELVRNSCSFLLLEKMYLYWIHKGEKGE